MYAYIGHIISYFQDPIWCIPIRPVSVLKASYQPIWFLYQTILADIKWNIACLYRLEKKKNLSKENKTNCSEGIPKSSEKITKLPSTLGSSIFFKLSLSNEGSSGVEAGCWISELVRAHRSWHWSLGVVGACWSWCSELEHDCCL